jgi:hypothetical protein
MQGICKVTLGEIRDELASLPHHFQNGKTRQQETE